MASSILSLSLLPRDLVDDLCPYLEIDDITNLSLVSTKALFIGLNNLRNERFMLTSTDELLEDHLNKHFNEDLVIKSAIEANNLTSNTDSNLVMEAIDNMLEYSRSNKSKNEKLTLKLIKSHDYQDLRSLSCVNIVTSNNNMQISKTLLELGAGVNSLTPILRIAIDANNIEMVKLLIRYGCNIDPENLMMAIVNGNVNILKVLIENGADVNCVSFGGRPIILACETFNIEIVKILIDAGADVNYIERNGSTLFDGLFSIIENMRYAFSTYDTLNEIIMTIVEADADLNIKTKQGNTPISECVVNKYFNVANILANANKMFPQRTNPNADLNIKDDKGKSAIDYYIKDYHKYNGSFRLLAKNIFHGQ